MLPNALLMLYVRHPFRLRQTAEGTELLSRGQFFEVRGHPVDPWGEFHSACTGKALAFGAAPLTHDLLSPWGRRGARPIPLKEVVRVPVDPAWILLWVCAG